MKTRSIIHNRLFDLSFLNLAPYHKPRTVRSMCFGNRSSINLFEKCRSFCRRQEALASPSSPGAPGSRASKSRISIQNACVSGALQVSGGGTEVLRHAHAERSHTRVEHGNNAAWSSLCVVRSCWLFDHHSMACTCFPLSIYPLSC